MTDKQMIIDSGQKWLDAFDSKVLYVSRETVKLVLKVLKEESQIVRCKDCKNRYKHSCGYFYANGQIMCDDWFCADGEVKENER